jgi:hypothetical protein
MASIMTLQVMIARILGGQQPQAPPQQPPAAVPAPPAMPGPVTGPVAGPDQAAPADPARPVRATVDSSLTVSSWPCGQVVAALAADIGRLTSKVSPQARQRYS